MRSDNDSTVLSHSIYFNFTSFSPSTAVTKILCVRDASNINKNIELNRVDINVCWSSYHCGLFPPLRFLPPKPSQISTPTSPSNHLINRPMGMVSHLLPHPSRFSAPTQFQWWIFRALQLLHFDIPSRNHFVAIEFDTSPNH